MQHCEICCVSCVCLYIWKSPDWNDVIKGSRVADFPHTDKIFCFDQLHGDPTDMRELTSAFHIRTINQSKLNKRQVSVDRFPEEVKVRITFYASFFWVTEYLRNNSLHSPTTKYI